MITKTLELEMYLKTGRYHAYLIVEITIEFSFSIFN
jgi:hypothetical protein